MTEACSGGPHTDCDDALHELYGFLDGELTDERRALITTHLDDCSPCLQAFDFENELRALVARKCRDEAPDSLRQRVADAIAHSDDAPDALPDR